MSTSTRQGRYSLSFDECYNGSAATIIRTFVRNHWQLNVCVDTALTSADGLHPVYYRLTVDVRYKGRYATHYSSPWASEPDLGLKSGFRNIFCETDNAVLKPLITVYGRATMGGAVKKARQWQTDMVKMRLKGGFDD